jgi:hypothetical protein
MGDRAVVEAAVSHFGNKDCFMGFAFAGWAQAVLPHPGSWMISRGSFAQSALTRVVESWP